jgi:hypothetical protein
MDGRGKVVTRPILAFALLAACAGCSGGSAIDREMVCSVTSSPARSPLAQGAEAWDWPPAARAEVERERWTETEESLIRSCGSGIQPPVVRLAFSADRKLALITRSSFERGGAPAPDPQIEQALELSGSIESCLLRREKVLSSEQWQPIACKLDAVS